MIGLTRKGGISIPTIISVSGDALPIGPASPGLIRHIAFQGDGVQVLHAEGEPGTISAWHHHGDHDVFGYVVRGSVRFEHGPGGRDVTLVPAGGFFRISPRLIHRDVNPSATEGQEVVLFLRGSGPMVVNQNGPQPD